MMMNITNFIMASGYYQIVINCLVTHRQTDQVILLNKLHKHYSEQQPFQNKGSIAWLYIT